MTTHYIGTVPKCMALHIGKLATLIINIINTILLMFSKRHSAIWTNFVVISL